MFNRFLMTLTTALMVSTAASAETITLRVLGQPSGSGLIAQQKEEPFFKALAEKTGLDIKVEYLPVDVAGIPDTDGLRILKSGLFDIVSIRGPQVSRDEPSVLGRVDKVDSQISGSVIQDCLLGGSLGARRPDGYGMADH